MRQILLFDTAIATSNLGDEIILESIKKELGDILYESLNFRLGTHIENFSLRQLGNDNWKYKVLCQNADYKFICGTNLLLQTVRGKNSQWQLNMFNAKLYDGSILVGVGKNYDYTEIGKYTKKLYLRCFSKKFKHSVRDEASKKILTDIGLNAINTGCPTLWCLSPEKCAGIPHNKADNVVLSVSGYVEQQDFESDCKLLACVKNNYSKVYAWIQTTEDKKYLDTLPNTEDIECIYSLEKYRDILNKGNIDYVGTRLHGGVYALQHNCRSIIISIDQRAEGFHDSNNIPIVKRTEIENKLNIKINSIWETNIIINQTAIDEFLKQF